MALQKAHKALHACNGQLASVKAEAEAAVNCLGRWQKIADEWVID